MKTYKCCYCGEVLTEDEVKSLPDLCCPSCLRTFDWFDYPDQVEEEKEDPQKLHDELFGNE